MLRIMLLGSGGGLPAAVLRELLKRHEVSMIAMPGSNAPWRRFLGAIRSRGTPDPLRQVARQKRISLARISSKDDPAWLSLLAEARPDLICIASFPWLLPRHVFEYPRLGAINLHPSLLPRRRGPSPMFWVYYYDDRETGVSVHRVTGGADTGDILGQEPIDLPEGTTIQELYDHSTSRGALLLARVVDQIEQGAAIAVPQDNSLASKDPRVPRGKPMVDFDNWPVDRVWRFLHGLYPHFREPLHDRNGRPVEYRGVGHFREERELRPPGTVESADGGWTLHCRGGVIPLRNGKAA